jgi:hypothetical protein
MKAWKQKQPVSISTRRVSIYVEQRNRVEPIKWEEWFFYFIDRIAWALLTAKLVAFAIRW